MSEWFEVAKLVDCPPGSVCEVMAGDQIVALMNIAGQLLAIDGICAHQGGPLGKGQLHQGVLTCPWHGWQYDGRTGCHLTSQRVVQQRYLVWVGDHPNRSGSGGKKSQEVRQVDASSQGTEKIWVQPI